MLKNGFKICLIGCLFFLIADAPVCYAAKQSPAKKLSQLPTPAQKTIQEFAGNGKIGEIEKTIEDGEVNYDVEVIKEGKTCSITVGVDGSLLYVQVFLPETPTAVQQTIQAQLNGGRKLGDIYKAIDGDEVTYEIETTLNNNSRNLIVGIDGKLLEIEISLTDAPVEVQKSIQKRLGEGRLSSVTKTFDEDKVFYDVETTTADRSDYFTVDSNGTLVSEKVDLSTTPEAVQKTIKNQSGNGKVAWIDKDYEGGEISYEVEIKRAGKTQSLSIEPDGKINPPE